MAALALSICAAASAEADGRRYVNDAEAATWSGVGMIFRKGGGSCTAVLIRPDVVLTAAHCVADADARTVARASDLTFSAGVKDGRSLQNMVARKVDVHPGYFISAPRYDPRRVRADIARVVLREPITAAPSYAVGRTPAAGAALQLLSYPGTARRRVSIEGGCRIVSRETEFLMLDCQSEPGSSGAPYFAAGPGGRPVVVGIHSGSRGRGADQRAMALAFEHVRSFIGSSLATDAARAPAPSNAAPTRAPSGGGAKARSGTRLPGGSKAGEGLKRFKR